MSAAETRRPDRMPDAMEPWQPTAMEPPAACLFVGAVPPLSIASHAASVPEPGMVRSWIASTSPGDLR